jgi:hypothetical protein
MSDWPCPRLASPVEAGIALLPIDPAAPDLAKTSEGYFGPPRFC